MISHDRERSKRQRNLKQEPDSIPQSNIEGDHHSRVAEEDQLDDHQQSKLPPNSGDPPVPTFSQLQRLLQVRRDSGVTPTSTQDNAVPTQHLTFMDELSQPEDKEASEFITPRMPSPSLDPLESFAATYQPIYDFTTQGDASQPQARLSKKRRMQSEAESTGRSDVAKNKSSKLRNGRDTSPSDLQALIGGDVSSRKAESSKIPQGRLEQDTLTAILPNDDGTDASSSEEHEVAQTVESSQPSLDVTMLSLKPNSGGFGRKAQHVRRPQEPTLNATSMHPDHTHLNDGNITQQQVITCIFTGLSKEQRESFDQNITRVIGAGLLMEHIQDQPFSQSTKHIITNADANILKQEGVALCPRVLKYLHGMLSGPWILSHDWFVDSIDAGVWLPLPQPKYMIQGDTQYGPAPGTQTRREIRVRKSMKLFNSCRMFFYGNFGGPGQKSITKDELLRLVRDGGAETWQRRPASKPLPSTGARNAMTGEESPNQDFFGPSRSFLYVTEDVKPWEVPIDRTAPIIVCDPGSIPSGSIKKGDGGQAESTKTLTQVDLKKHGWLRDYQAVSLMWLLNCISCSIMGAQDIELLYGSKDSMSLSDESPIAEEEICKLSQAWSRWRNRN
ncbi:BRCA1-associated RING domain protein 1 [Mortierella sp. AD011]|nr:BRCA1-associated RING domain protein 1 [Mortierella sp. AD010]KAF9387135.1 BRCA1-associated RING domain protein 1 [Mortierella sp. AD011]